MRGRSYRNTKMSLELRQAEGSSGLQWFLWDAEQVPSSPFPASTPGGGWSDPPLLLLLPSLKPLAPVPLTTLPRIKFKESAVSKNESRSVFNTSSPSFVLSPQPLLHPSSLFLEHCEEICRQSGGDVASTPSWSICGYQRMKPTLSFGADQLRKGSRFLVRHSGSWVGLHGGLTWSGAGTVLVGRCRERMPGSLLSNQPQIPP